MLNKILTDIEQAFTRKRRKFLYKAATLGAGIAAYHGFVSGDVALQIVSGFGLLTGMADLNTPWTEENREAALPEYPNGPKTL